jgi:hypothetical protein
MESQPEGGNFWEELGKDENVDDGTSPTISALRSFYSEAL